MRRLNILLAVVVVVLAAMCVVSVSSPIRFERERAQRETKVKQRLLQIRTAAENYRRQTGAYTASMATLVKGGFLADSLRYIPFADGKQFHIEASAVATRSGRQLPVMECSATYAEYLDGLDVNAIHNITVAANDAGRFAGLKIGDLATPNDNRGNWE